MDIKIVILVLLLVPMANAYVTTTQRDITTLTTNGKGTTQKSDGFPFSMEGWVNYWWITHDAIFGYNYGRPLASFNLSAVEHGNIKYRSVKMKGTFDESEGSDDLIYKKITSLYTTADNYLTVYNQIGSVDAYSTQTTTDTVTDLGASAVIQIETAGWRNITFAIGMMGSEPYPIDRYMLITALNLYVDYYYPPSTADTWVINESYNLAKSGSSGIGQIIAHGDMNITSEGILILNGDTDLSLSGAATKLIKNSGIIQLEDTSRITI